MSVVARFLHLASPCAHGVRSKHCGATTSTPPGFTGHRSRRGRPSSCPRSASPPTAHSAAAVRARGGGDGERAAGTEVASSGGGADYTTPDQIKAALLQSLQGINRGIFGVQSRRRSEIEGLVQLLESRNPTPDPTDHLDQVDGCWKLLYSTVTILGSKRTKLGLRDFVSLGDFFQKIDVVRGKAINEIKFSVRGLRMLSGQLTIVASFRIASTTVSSLCILARFYVTLITCIRNMMPCHSNHSNPNGQVPSTPPWDVIVQRVDIKFESSDISPEQLMNLFQKNYDLLLAIFNPEGWLEIRYVDESMRIGRDDKGNTFILERASEEKAS